MTTMRTFNTGATRDLDDNKLDYEGFLCPLVLERYAQYLHKHRETSNGFRDSDNWQNGIPQEVYIKSAWRHFHAVWKNHRGYSDNDITEELCALLFNIMGYLHDEIKITAYSDFFVDTEEMDEYAEATLMEELADGY